jgi:hypothetical protein
VSAFEVVGAGAIYLLLALITTPQAVLGIGVLRIDQLIFIEQAVVQIAQLDH